jgi:DNA-binding Lrp family transcriptional regulator
MKEEPDDHRAELLTLLRGAPQMATGSLAREIGVTEAELHGLVEKLEADGRIVRGEEGRLVVVEPAAAPYEPGEEPV